MSLLNPTSQPPLSGSEKGGLASASPASPASIPSLVLRATGTSSCGLGWGGSQLRVPRGRCSKLGLVHDVGGAARLPCSLLICKDLPTERRIHSLTNEGSTVLFVVLHFGYWGFGLLVLSMTSASGEFGLLVLS